MQPAVQQGQVLLGKYQVERVLGEGGMGIVLAARHIHLNELFAIKMMLPAALAHKDAVERFLREARAAARLKGEHVARVHDVGSLENGAPYMVMEHLNGNDLKAHLQKQGVLAIDEAAMLIYQACEAIAEAHANGIIHRDLKPANLFLIRRPNGTPCVKVLDFGISKELDPNNSARSDLTKTGMFMGSPMYMSPEQMANIKATDMRSDIWALGVILYELVTSTVPFDAEAMTELVTRVLTMQPLPPSQLRPGIPAAFDTLVLRCLEKRPENRFQAVGDLMTALHPFTTGNVQSTLLGVAGVVVAPPLIKASTVRISHPQIAVAQTEMAPPGGHSNQLGDSARLSSPSGQFVAPIDNLSSSSRLSTAPAPSAQTGGAFSSTNAVPPRKSRAPMVAAIGILVAVGGIGVGALVANGSKPKVSTSTAESASIPAPTATAVTTTAKTEAAGQSKDKSKKWWDDLSTTPQKHTATTTPAMVSLRKKWIELRGKAEAAEKAQKREEAAYTLRIALDVACRQLGQEDPACAETLKGLAMLMTQMGNLAEAEKLLREAVKVTEKYGNPVDDDFDDSRQALVAVLVKQGKTEEAKEFSKPNDPPLPEPPPSAKTPSTATTAPPKAAAPAPTPKPTATSAPEPTATSTTPKRSMW